MTGNRYIYVYILLHILIQYLGCILCIHYLQYSCGSKIKKTTNRFPIHHEYIIGCVHIWNL